MPFLANLKSKKELKKDSPEYVDHLRDEMKEQRLEEENREKEEIEDD